MGILPMRVSPNTGNMPPVPEKLKASCSAAAPSGIFWKDHILPRVRFSENAFSLRGHQTGEICSKFLYIAFRDWGAAQYIHKVSANFSGGPPLSRLPPLASIAAKWTFKEDY
jgi:hypothetical protein